MVKPGTYCFIINCASNAYKAESIFNAYKTHIEERLPESAFIYIRESDSIESVIHKIFHNYSHFVACGGDGTVNRVANALTGTSKIMGVLPLGSGNDFAKNIGLTGKTMQDLEILFRDRIVKVDAVKYGNQYFINTYGIGVDGLTNYHASRSKFKSGNLRYFFAGLKALFTSETFDIKIICDDSNEIIYPKIWMIAIANGCSEGGKYVISPNSINSDGKAEIIIVKGVSRIRLIIEFMKLSLGFSFWEGVVKQLSLEKILHLTTSKQVRSHADGEQIGLKHEFHFEMYPSALNVVINVEINR